MKKIILTLLTVVYLFGLGFTASIIIHSPNGGESWVIGSPKNIRWTGSGLTNPVKISLFKNNVLVGEITNNQPASGTFPWTVGNYQGGTANPGNDYKIKIKELGKPNSIKSAGTFEIKSMPLFEVVPFPTPPPIATIILPDFSLTDIRQVEGILQCKVENIKAGPPIDLEFKTHVNGIQDGSILKRRVSFTSPPQWINLFMFPMDSGSHKFKVEVNPRHKPRELKYDNNSLEKRLSLKGNTLHNRPDFYIHRIFIAPDKKVYIKIGNKGHEFKGKLRIGYKTEIGGTMKYVDKYCSILNSSQGNPFVETSVNSLLEYNLKLVANPYIYSYVEVNPLPKSAMVLEGDTTNNSKSKNFVGYFKTGDLKIGSLKILGKGIPNIPIIRGSSQVIIIPQRYQVGNGNVKFQVLCSLKNNGYGIPSNKISVWSLGHIPGVVKDNNSVAAEFNDLGQVVKTRLIREFAPGSVYPAIYQNTVNSKFEVLINYHITIKKYIPGAWSQKVLIKHGNQIVDEISFKVISDI